MLVEGPLAALETLFNRQILASTPARASLARLEGRSFAVALTGQGRVLLRLRMTAAREGLRLGRDTEPADAEVSGSPFRLVRLLGGRREGGHHEPGVTISGDALLAQAFEQLFKQAHPDIEAELARLLGDEAALLAVRTVRSVFDTARRVAASFGRSSAEFLVEEGRDVVGRDELAEFHHDVDRLRDDVARIEARLNRLTPSPVER